MGCRKYRGLMAQSLYEAPAPGESAALERHLDACARCREEYAGLRAIVEGVPAEAAVFTGDLLPVLRARIAEEAMAPAVSASGIWRWAWRGAAAGLAVVAGAAFLARMEPATVPRAPETQVASIAPAPETHVSALDETLSRADALERSREYTAALALLEEALASAPEDPRAGEAQLRVARIEFEHLRRYPRAHAAFETLARAYPETYREHPRGIQAYELLAEARTNDFDALYALDAARNDTRAALPRLEEVIARFPGTYVATLAVEEMARRVGAELSGPEFSKLAALEAVRAHCTDPVAIAQVQLALGDAYYLERRDVARAEDLYTAASQSGHPELEARARDALARLGTAPGR